MAKKQVTMRQATEAWIRYESSIVRETRPVTIELKFDGEFYHALRTFEGETEPQEIYYQRSRGDVKVWIMKRYAKVTYK